MLQKHAANHTLIWSSKADEDLLAHVPPLSQLIAAKVAGPWLQGLLKERKVSFCVEDELLFIRGQQTSKWSRPLQGVPDLVITITQQTGAAPVASMTDESRRALKYSGSFTQGKTKPLSRREFIIKHGISEDAFENWCSFCGLDFTLSRLTAQDVSLLEKYKSLTDSEVLDQDIFEMFN